jgi:hypothetical protein
MGALYLAKDPKIGRLLAIKLVRQEIDTPEARHRFALEAKAAGTLRHPKIVTVFDVDHHDGLPFIAMEYIDGETLAEIIKRRAVVPIAQRLTWIEDLCAGLSYAHRNGIVHRDIKPANLMVDAEGTLKILDFGLARHEASTLTMSNAMIGTPAYMSPEQLRGERVDARSDMFSVGTVLHELLTYTEAFPGMVHQAINRILHEEPRPLGEVMPGVDPAISEILTHALAKDRERRYRDLTEMEDAIAEVRLRIEAEVEASSSGSHTAVRDSAADWVAGARVEIQRGLLDRADALVIEAERLAPESGEVRELRATIDSARVEIERSRRVKELMRRARARFAEEGFAEAVRTADEVLAINPVHAEAHSLRMRAAERLEAARMQIAEAVRAMGRTASPADTVFAPSGIVGRFVRPVATLSPTRQYLIDAALVTAFVGAGAVVIARPWASPPSPSVESAAIEPAPAAAPVPPATVPTRAAAAISLPAASPPPSKATATAPPAPKPSSQTQDDADVVVAYEWLKAGRVVESRQLADTIAGRSPLHAGLGALRVAIDARLEDDRRREALALSAAAQDQRARELDARVEADRPPAGITAAAAPPDAALVLPPASSGRLERPAIEKVLQEWAGALATRDIATISRVRSLTATEVASWRNIFGRIKAYRLHVEMTGEPEIVGNQALVPIEEVVIMTDQRGIDLTNSPRRYNYRMHKVGGQWRLLAPNTPMPTQAAPDAR